MTELMSISGKGDQSEVSWEKIKLEVENLTGGGGTDGAGENLIAEDLQGAKQVGKIFLANLNKAFDAQKAGEAQRGRKQTGWMAVALPFIEAGIVTGVEMFRVGKKAK